MLLKPIWWEILRWNPTITCFISISLVLWMVFSGVNIRMNIEEIIEGYQYVGSQSQWNRVDPSRINENCWRWCCHASHLPPKQIHLRCFTRDPQKSVLHCDSFLIHSPHGSIPSFTIKVGYNLNPAVTLVTFNHSVSRFLSNLRPKTSESLDRL